VFATLASAPDPAALAKFYQEVLDLAEVPAIGPIRPPSAPQRFSPVIPPRGRLTITEEECAEIKAELDLLQPKRGGGR